MTDGVLDFPSASACMTVPHNDVLNVTDAAATIYFWFQPEACPTGENWRPLNKMEPGGAQNFNYYFGLWGTEEYPPGTCNWRATGQDGQRYYVSGTSQIQCSGEMTGWYNVLWVYEAGTGGTMYFNGAPFADGFQGKLLPVDTALSFGNFRGRMDDILILNRAATESEIIGIAQTLNGTAYDTNQAITLSLEVDDPSTMPPTMSFSIDDAIPVPTILESEIALRVTEPGPVTTTVWSRRSAQDPNDLDYRYQLVDVPLEGWQSKPGPLTFTFQITNRQTRHEEILLYFVEDHWRNADWIITVTPEENAHWTSLALADDPTGDRGPVDPWVDELCYGLDFMDEMEFARATAKDKPLSFYLPWLTTQPAPVNNRFLYGIYAAGLGVKDVMVSFYGNWGTDAWDDCEPNLDCRSVGVPARGASGYQLIMPSWEDKVYDTIIYESLWEGVEDSRIIATLRKTIEEHPGAAATAAEAYLRDVLNRPLRDFAPRYMNLDPNYVQSDNENIDQYANRSAEMLMDLAGDPTAFDVFDDIRRTMLGYILVLNGAATDCNSNFIAD